MDNESIKDVLIENKGKIIFVVICIILSIVIGLFNKTGNGKVRDNAETALKAYASDYYRTYYTEYIMKEVDKEDLGMYFSAFKTNPLKITLNTLIDNMDDLNMNYFENIGKQKKYCDLYNTYALVTPITPYGEDDFEIEIHLDCEYTKNS